MELHQVRYFVALARTLHFTRAADECSITQPALTKAVKRLEQELGGSLVHRERQLTQLTDLGKLVLPMLERTLAAADAARTHAREFQSTAIAPLRLALAPCISACLVAPPLAEMTRSIPGLQVELLEHDGDNVATGLLEGTYSAAFVGDTVDLPDRMDHWSLFEEHFVVLCRSDNEIAQMAEVPTDVLLRATWLELIGCQPVRDLWDRISSSAGSVRVAHRGRNVAHLQHMAEAGLGVLLLPRHIPRLPSLVARPIAGEAVRRTVSLVAVAGRHHAPALQALVKVARVRNWQHDFDGGLTNDAPNAKQIVATDLTPQAIATVRTASTTGPTSTLPA